MIDLPRNILTAEGDVTIRPIQETDSFEEMTELLHRAYRVLADRGLRFVATYQDALVTRRRAMRGLCFIAEKDGKPVGTITYYSPTGQEGVDWYQRSDVAHFGQFAVEPGMQGLGIGSALIRLAEEIAVQRGMTELALDTSEQAVHLIAYYQRRGYRLIGYYQWDVTNYRSVILSKRLRSDPGEA